MANTEVFFNNLLGIHDLKSNGGSLLPRRSTLNIKGGSVEDVNGVTQITVPNTPVWDATDGFILSGTENDITTDGFAESTDILLLSATSATITGFDAAGILTQRKRIWNFSSEGVLVLHDDSGSLSANRVLTPGGTTLTIEAGTTITIQRAADNLKWRALKCLI